MTSLIACIGTGAAAAKYVEKLAQAEPWEKIFIIAGEGAPRISPGAAAQRIEVHEKTQLLADMTEAIRARLDGKIADTEVALNLVSGSGKMHMAALSAILRCGLGVRLVALTPDGMKEV